MLGKLAKNADSGMIPKELKMCKSGVGPRNVHFSKCARWFCCGYLGYPLRSRALLCLGSVHLLSEHSLGSYTMPGTVPGAIEAGRVPEQQAPWWQASEEADEMGCRHTGDGGLGIGCPSVLLREAPCRRVLGASGNILHLSDQPASFRLVFESSNSNLMLLRSSLLPGPP